MISLTTLLMTVMTGINYPSLIAEGDSASVCYEKVVHCAGQEQDDIYNSILKYMKETEEIAGVDSVSLNGRSQISGAIELKIYNYIIGAIKNPAGKTFFHLRVSVKEEKFKYRIDSIRFQSYQRNRYGQFVASNDKPSLVRQDSGYGHRVFKKIDKQLKTYMTQQITNIKQRIEADEAEEIDW